MFGLRWGKNAFNFEGMPTGPQPLRNLSRLPNGKANAGRLVGDYNNPILTPYAAGVVKQKGELAAAGKGFPNSQDQCRPEAPPFAMAMTLDLTMLPTKNGDIAIWSGPARRGTAYPDECNASGETCADADGRFGRPLGRRNAGHRYHGH